MTVCVSSSGRSAANTRVVSASMPARTLRVDTSMTGALPAVQERLPCPVAAVDLIVGTSAGSVLAAALRCGTGIDEMIAHQRGEAVGVLADAGVGDAADGPWPPPPALRVGSPRLLTASLLMPHRSYLSVLRPLLTQHLVKGLAHITGGGITENVPRILPEGCDARVDRQAWVIPAVFRLLQERGDIADDEMFRVFNMGIGLVIVSAASDANRVAASLEQSGERPVRLGVVVPGPKRVSYA